MKETKSTCPYCGVGCGVVIESDGLQITGVRGDPEHPANLGRLCTKGSTLHLTAARLCPAGTFAAAHAQAGADIRTAGRELGSGPGRTGWRVSPAFAPHMGPMRWVSISAASC
jgi:hypothetical protein